MPTSRPLPPTRRARVVVYVTREHPVTGADQLLVLEDPELPGLDCPAGGIEADETPEQAAARKVREETGLERIEVVRHLGKAEQPGLLEPGFLPESHFLQAKPTGGTPEDWEHEGLPVRWEPIRADLPLRPPHGAFLHALIRERVVGYVTRRREGRVELLTIRYAGHDFEVPAGRLDPGEDHVDGLAREVEEEAGVTGIQVLALLADADEFERLYGAGAHRSYAFHAEAFEERDEWEHVIAGSGADSGLTHLCRWVALEKCPPLWGNPDPLVEKLRRSISEA